MGKMFKALGVIMLIAVALALIDRFKVFIIIAIALSIVGFVVWLITNHKKVKKTDQAVAPAGSQQPASVEPALTNAQDQALGSVDWDYADELTELSTKQYVVLDVETTGFSPKDDRIIEIAAVKCSNDQIIDKLQLFVNPEKPLPDKITNITGITEADLCGAPIFADVAESLISFIDDLPVVAHNARFDAEFIDAALERCGLVYAFECIDTLSMSRDAFPRFENYKLSTLIDALELSDEPQKHRAMSDVEATHRLYIKCRDRIIEKRARHFKSMLKKAVRAAPEEQARMFCDIGIEYESCQDIENALQCFEKAVELKANYPVPYQRLAINYKRLKRFDDEIRISNLALQQLPCNNEDKKKWERRIELALKKLNKP